MANVTFANSTSTTGNTTVIGNTGIELITPVFSTVINLPDGGNSSWPTCDKVAITLQPPFSGKNISLTAPYYVWSWSPNYVPEYGYGGKNPSFNFSSPYPAGASAKYFFLDTNSYFGTSTDFTTMTGGQSAQNCSGPTYQRSISLKFAPNSPSDCTNATLLIGGGAIGDLSFYYTGTTGLAEIDVNPNELPQTLRFDPNTLRVGYNSTTNAPLGSPIDTLWVIVQDGLDVTSQVLTMSSPANCTIKLEADPSITALITPTPPSTGSSNHTGAIVGGVVGGVVGLALAAIAAFFLYRRGKRHGIASAGGILDYDKTEPVTEAVGGHPVTYDSTGALAREPSQALSPTSAASPNSVEPLSPVRYLQHQDIADVSPGANDEGVVELPPVYSDHSRRPAYTDSTGDEGGTMNSSMAEAGSSIFAASSSSRAPLQQQRSLPVDAKGWMPGEASSSSQTLDAPVEQQRQPQALDAKGWMPGEEQGSSSQTIEDPPVQQREPRALDAKGWMPAD